MSSVFSHAINDLKLKTDENLTVSTSITCQQLMISDNGFLKDVPPSLRRSLLAAHQVRIEEIKSEIFWKQYQLEEKLRTDVLNEMTHHQSVFEIETIGESLASSKINTDCDEQNTPHGATHNKRKRIADMGESSYDSGSGSCSEADNISDDDALPLLLSLSNPTASTSSTTNKLSQVKSNGSSIKDERDDSSSHQPSKNTSPLRNRISQTSSSTIYHKFITHFQSFYNEHDSLGLSTMLLYPCYAPILNRAFVLWNTCYQSFSSPSTVMSLKTSRSLKNSISTNSFSSSLLPSVSHTSPSSIVLKVPFTRTRQTLEPSYSKIFNKLPDSLIIYYHDRIHIKCHSKTGNIYVYAPYRYFATIPSLTPRNFKSTTTSSQNNKKKREVIIRNIAVELVCCTVLTYCHESGLIIAEEDHCYRVHVSNPLVQVDDVLEYFMV